MVGISHQHVLSYSSDNKKRPVGVIPAGLFIKMPYAMNIHLCMAFLNNIALLLLYYITILLR